MGLQKPAIPCATYNSIPDYVGYDPTQGPAVGKSALYCGRAARSLYVAQTRRWCAGRHAKECSTGPADAAEPLFFQNAPIEWRKGQEWQFCSNALNTEESDV